MNENSSFTALIQRVCGGCERMKRRRANGLMRAAGKRKRVMADGIRVRYQSVACACAQNEWRFYANRVVPQRFIFVPVIYWGKFFIAPKQKFRRV